MDINHGNFEKHRYLPWFKWRYRVHAEVNGKEGGKGEKGDRNGYRNGESRLAGTERGRERQIGKSGASGGRRGAATKTGDTSVGNVH